MSFHVGQIVVCVESWLPTPGYGTGGERGPLKGHIYTVRETLIAWDAEPSVRLAEIVNPTADYRTQGLVQYEVAFRNTRFRPVDDNRLAVFRKALTSAPKHEEVT